MTKISYTRKPHAVLMGSTQATRWQMWDRCAPLPLLEQLLKARLYGNTVHWHQTGSPL